MNWAGEKKEQKVRLFTAILLPDHIIAELSTAQRLIAKGMNYAIKKIPKENLHMTVSFFGNVNQSLVPTLELRLAQVPRSSYSIVMERIECRRGVRGTSLIWARAADNAELVQLKGASDAALDGKEPERTTFVPHVTMFRLKEAQQLAMVKKVVSELSFLPLTFTVDGFALMRSLASPAGVRYLEVARFS